MMKRVDLHRCIAGALVLSCACALGHAGAAPTRVSTDPTHPTDHKKTDAKTPPKPGKDPVDQPATKPSPAASPDASIVMLGEKTAAIEDEIAQLIQKRGDVPASLGPWLELQIDCRIVADALMTQAAKNTGEVRTAAYLHALSMRALVPNVDALATKQNVAPDPVQQSVLTKLHAFTFHLGESKGVSGTDATAASVAELLQFLLLPPKPGERLDPLPPMRPAVAEAVTATMPSNDDHGPRSIAELSALARQATVSPALRRQLLALSATAQAAADAPPNSTPPPAKKDPGASPAADAPKESEVLRDQLQTAIDLSAGLQTNTAVAPEERAKIEGQLSDGLALFGDPRTRSAGQARLDSLDAYRELVARVGKMRVPPELSAALSPALAWAHQNPEQGEKVLGTIEQFIKLHLRHEARPREPKELAGFRPTEPLRRAYDEVSKQFGTERSIFLGDVSELATAKADALMPTGATPDSLAAHVQDMEHLEDLLDTLVGIPKTLESLAPFKPRPSGGVDRRLTTIYVALISPVKSPAKDDAVTQLDELHTLGTIAADLSAHPVGVVAPAVALSYTNNQTVAVDAKWKAMVTDLAGSFAAGTAMDAGKIDRLKNARALIDALAPAMTAEAALAKPEPLAKWADWTLTVDQVHALVAPYQQAMLAGYTGFIGDDSQAVNDFIAARKKYEPLLNLVARTGGYSEACAALPDGTEGALARLATPYDKQPFADQRFASFQGDLATASADPVAADEAAVKIAGHMGK